MFRDLKLYQLGSKFVQNNPPKSLDLSVLGPWNPPIYSIQREVI